MKLKWEQNNGSETFVLYTRQSMLLHMHMLLQCMYLNLFAHMEILANFVSNYTALPQGNEPHEKGGTCSDVAEEKSTRGA